ncbi:uncharacterized protein MONOS_6921 [Monocercomonoides exilis]|uniref:uncharacterized protein n=1 Tax=Monocercomonoides exilis TaxID=2049356 RepID=UPI003559BE69|nr:hypothetical protein MONOS_6921 [Monocercomonoides exilis]|eukprot:MONOS_6921.1-p1 / transcript=MONOS_6921.1 / gene=MONOS_6921 / organism=Monocercomonoides_exilis_PA203 / gene_product=unspecified product / transcript_product=unspecified product / location=Mono_scaffold00227:20941-21438(+) / protein_length=166 / sequence_SO=supercontig / SO=protein_coding / is_pseudo=false
MPLSLQLLLSPRALQTLRGYVVALLAMLSVPLVALLPSLTAFEGKKWWSKRIFAAPNVNAFPSIYDLFDLSLQIWQSQQSRRVVMKLDEEVMGRGVAVCEVGEIVEKALETEGMKMEDVVLSTAAIPLNVLVEGEKIFGIFHAAAKDPMQREDIEAEERVGRAAA